MTPMKKGVTVCVIASESPSYCPHIFYWRVCLPLVSVRGTFMWFSIRAVPRHCRSNLSSRPDSRVLTIGLCLWYLKRSHCSWAVNGLSTMFLIMFNIELTHRRLGMSNLVLNYRGTPTRHCIGVLIMYRIWAEAVSMPFLCPFFWRSRSRALPPDTSETQSCQALVHQNKPLCPDWTSLVLTADH